MVRRMAASAGTMPAALPGTGAGRLVYGNLVADFRGLFFAWFLWFVFDWLLMLLMQVFEVLSLAARSEVMIEALLLLVAVCLGGLVFLACWNQRLRHRLLAQQRQVAILSAAQGLLKLMRRVQQHRGLSSGLLAGESGFLAGLVGKREEIDVLLPSLRELARSESAMSFPVLTLQDLALFRFHWRELSDKLQTLSVEQSIAQHTLLIGQLQKWLAGLGESRIEPLLAAQAPAGLVRNYLVRLPALSELLGQARALGTAVASQQACSAVARVRLTFLVARSETLLAQALACSSEIPEADLATRAVQQMARVVRTQMLLSSGIAVDAESYFAIATRAIDAVFDWIDVSGVWVSAAVESQRAQTELASVC